MEFYYGNNLIKEDFLCSLVSWRPESDWRILAVGHPHLSLDLRRKSLLLSFLERRRGRKVFSREVNRLSISAEFTDGTLLLESKDSLEDFGLSFATPESCSRFAALLDYYQNIS
ncbi:MAG: hypothetical protein IM572_07885 [Chitinophagaceae bacterium]|jgi:hypothetical protein|nr:hypothetical protein [Chitinophagaceae bacterium]